MNTKLFLALHGGIYAVFAVVLFFMPAWVWPMYGVQINDQYSFFLSQHTSIFLGGLAAVSLFLRSVEHAETIIKLLQALLVTNLLGVVITVYAGLTGVFVGFGWSDPVFFSLLASLCYAQLRRFKSKH